MLRNIIGPVFNFRNCVVFVAFLLVFQKSSSFCRENEKNKTNKKTKQTNKKMDQILTLKRAKIGPVFNFTAHIYIYMHMYMYMYMYIYMGGRPHLVGTFYPKS